MTKLSNEAIAEYTLKRQEKCSNTDTRSPCIAPFNNMYFTTNGNIAPCWLMVGQTDTWEDTKSIKEIWNGENFTRLRENLSNNTFEKNCNICQKKIGVNTWPLAMAYDSFTVKEYPTLLELELSNQCNLECIMCEGRLSSGIRKNRDKLPPLPNVYDDDFVEQIKEFIPHLEELRFNGGEPFAQKIVYDICMLVKDLNPELKITIATNGTVYNKQVQQILDNCNIHLNISIDSLNKENYERIRINGDFDVLMHNFIIFKDYCLSNNRILSVMINPMRNNWREMSDFVRFTNKHGVHLWYNTIHHPEHLGIWNLSTNELSTIKTTLESQIDELKPDYKDFSSLGNWEKYKHFVNNQISDWFEKSKKRIVIQSE
jgi:radical SAM protein with 4Fe4S-binding SPASM domain